MVKTFYLAFIYFSVALRNIIENNFILKYFSWIDFKKVYVTRKYVSNYDYVPDFPSEYIVLANCLEQAYIAIFVLISYIAWKKN